MESRKDERSLGELFADLSRESATLVRQEVTLARVELGQKVSQAGKDVGSLAIGGAIAYAGFLALIAGVILLLAKVIDPWLAAVIVGIILAVGGYMMLQTGLHALQGLDLAPKQTMETLREGADMVKERTQ